MKFSNFKILRAERKNDRSFMFYGSVVVETGVLFWKKKSTIQIAKVNGYPWYKVSNGQYMPQSCNDFINSVCVL